MSDDSDQLTHLEREYENARERLQQQRETLDSLSNNSYRMARLELFLIGAIVAVLSAVGERSQLVQFLLETKPGSIGLGLLLLSTFFFILSTLGERIYVETVGKPKDIQSVLSGDQTRNGYLSNRLEHYESRISHNDDLMEYFGNLMSAGTVFMILGFGVIGYGAFQNVVSGGTYALIGIAVLVVSIFIYCAMPKPPDDVDPNIGSKADN